VEQPEHSPPAKGGDPTPQRRVGGSASKQQESLNSVPSSPDPSVLRTSPLGRGATFGNLLAKITTLRTETRAQIGKLEIKEEEVFQQIPVEEIIPPCQGGCPDEIGTGGRVDEISTLVPETPAPEIPEPETPVVENIAKPAPTETETPTVEPVIEPVETEPLPEPESEPTPEPVPVAEVTQPPIAPVAEVSQPRTEPQVQQTIEQNEPQIVEQPEPQTAPPNPPN
ncbi:hypothetical protein K9M43_03395, partial [Candidatus Gracilibacteria bacterium]|nr:hypothetical protein [Candidatus Gracilibacteria bacterium]